MFGLLIGCQQRVDLRVDFAAQRVEPRLNLAPHEVHLRAVFFQDQLHTGPLLRGEFEAIRSPRGLGRS